jgi:hypothetical protein
MAPPDAGPRLRVPVEGPLSADDLVGAFSAINSAYVALYEHESVQTAALRLAADLRPDIIRSFAVPPPEEPRWRRSPWRRASYGWYWPGSLGREDRLVVVRVEFASPGFSVFGGAGGPLETLRKTAQDRHERRKDKEWREDLDREQQEADIALRRGEEERVEAEARSLRAKADQEEVEAFRQKYALLKELLGVEEARRWAVRELADSRLAFDALAGNSDEEPRLLDPPPTSIEDPPNL